MTQNNFKKEAGAAAPTYVSADDSALDHLKRMFRTWRDIEAKIAANEADVEEGAIEKADDDAYRMAQKALMDTAAAIRGSSLEDILYKLALWRWEAGDLGASLDEMKRGDAMVYSAFRDLAELTGESDVVTERDRRTDFLRKPDPAAEG